MSSDETTDDSDVDNVNLKYLTWAGYLEDLMAKWSDNALSYAWLHNKAEAKYRKLNYAFTIPIVILSTVIGTINVGMNSIFPANLLQVGNIIIGGLSIFTGILGTLQNFFKYAQLSEAHRNSAIQWHKFHRTLKTELALESVCRRNAGEFFRSSKAELDRLLDSSPYIPSDVVHRYVEENTIDLPDVIGHLQKTLVFRGGIRMSPKPGSPTSSSYRKTPTMNNENFIKISRDLRDIELTPNPLSPQPTSVSPVKKKTHPSSQSSSHPNQISRSERNDIAGQSLNLSQDEIDRVKSIAGMISPELLSNVGDGVKKISDSLSQDSLNINIDDLNNVRQLFQGR